MKLKLAFQTQGTTVTNQTASGDSETFTIPGLPTVSNLQIKETIVRITKELTKECPEIEFQSGMNVKSVLLLKLTNDTVKNNKNIDFICDTLLKAQFTPLRSMPLTLELAKFPNESPETKILIDLVENFWPEVQRKLGVKVKKLTPIIAGVGYNFFDQNSNSLKLMPSCTFDKEIIKGCLEAICFLEDRIQKIEIKYTKDPIAESRKLFLQTFCQQVQDTEQRKEMLKNTVTYALLNEIFIKPVEEALSASKPPPERIHIPTKEFLNKYGFNLFEFGLDECENHLMVAVGQKGTNFTEVNTRPIISNIKNKEEFLRKWAEQTILSTPENVLLKNDLLGFMFFNTFLKLHISEFETSKTKTLKRLEALFPPKVTYEGNWPTLEEVIANVKSIIEKE